MAGMKAEEVLGGLLKVREAALTKDKPCWFVLSCGICKNLSKHIGKYYAYKFVKEYALGWDEHSGSLDLPVEGDYCSGNCWVGEYGAARLRLLDYLIEQMEKFGDEEVNWEESV